jgi:hypothetical protein
LLHAKDALDRAKAALLKAKDELWEAMKTYDKACESTCSHKEEFHILWEDGMCCPKVWFECNGVVGSGADRECDGGTNDDTTSNDATAATLGGGSSDN